MKLVSIPAVCLLCALLGTNAIAADTKREALWAAVRAGDLKAIQKTIDDGANVNARNEYGVTAMWIATSKEQHDVIELLVKKGADVNAMDDIWYMTPLGNAVTYKDPKTAVMLIKAGAKDTDDAFLTAVTASNLKMAKAIQSNAKIGQETLDASLFQAKNSSKKELVDWLVSLGAKPIPPLSEDEKKKLRELVAYYDSDGGSRLAVGINDAGLMINGRLLKQKGDEFSPIGPAGASFRVERKDGVVTRIVMKRLSAEYSFYKFKEPPTKPKAPVELGSAAVTSPANWPSFRGPDGTGVAEGQKPPLSWNVKTNEGVRWKTPIPGLGHSCPVIWENRIFVTTAISTGVADPKVRIGNYGDVGSVDDTSKHRWQLLCLDRDSGEILWTKTAFEGIPKIKRHLKGSQANCTPATDGKHIVVCFGSEGLYCYDFSGKLIWSRDLSTLDSSFALDQEYEWGFGASPVIHEDKCILQCDLSRDSFIAAFSMKDGAKVWSTPRDEIPSWSSPVVWRNSKGTEIVTNAAQYARGYDPTTGKELWRIAKKSEITVPTPVLGKDLAFISSGNRPIQPIIAIKPGASGDISLKENETSNASVAWSKLRGGPYMPTPILYKEYLYTCSNSGVLSCYEASTGKEIYKERMGGTSYVGSPVASDDRLYFVSEEGEVRVVKAGKQFELLTVNTIGDYCLSCPAISNGSFFVRSQHYLWSFGSKTSEKK